MSKQALVCSATVKIPEVVGRASVQKMVRPDGCESDNPCDWDVEHEQEVDNLVLNQGKSLYGFTGIGSSTVNQAIPMADWLKNVWASDDGAAPDASNTAMAGTVHQFNNVLSRTVSDAGDYLGNGKGYTKTTIEAVLYQKTGLSAGFTVNKIYGEASIDPVDGFDKCNIPNVGDITEITDLAVSEFLLASPVTINNPEEEAVKIIYSIYWPRMIDVADEDSLPVGAPIEIGSGSIVVKDKAYDGTVDDGPTKNWTLYFRPHESVNDEGNYRFDCCSILATDPNADVFYTHTADHPMENDYDYRNANEYGGSNTSITQSYSDPSSTQRKFTEEAVMNNHGNIGSVEQRNMIIPLRNGRFSVLYIFFDTDIDVEWNETLEVHTEITIDWS